MGLLQVVKQRAMFDALWQAPPIQAALGHLGADAVWAEVQRRDSGAVEPPKTIKRAELETLLASREEIGDDRPGNEFFARRMTLPADRSGAMKKVERVVLLHRLREVLSLVGFSRFEAQHTDVDGELALGVRRAEIAQEPRWMPTIENRGEGFFIAFDRKLVEEWTTRPPVEARRDELRAGYQAWQEEHPDAPIAFPGVEYIMLHSLAHLLITAVSLECGYSSSSIRERVYVNEIGYGVLLYTGTFDSEGTLGGLVEAARRLPVHLRNALDLARLCSNDPVCAQHAPWRTHERRHELLDRALVIGTVDTRGAAFFSEG